MTSAIAAYACSDTFPYIYYASSDWLYPEANPSVSPIIPPTEPRTPDAASATEPSTYVAESVASPNAELRTPADVPSVEFTMLVADESALPARDDAPPRTPLARLDAAPIALDAIPVDEDTAEDATDDAAPTALDAIPAAAPIPELAILDVAFIADPAAEATPPTIDESNDLFSAMTKVFTLKL